MITNLFLRHHVVPGATQNLHVSLYLTQLRSAGGLEPGLAATIYNIRLYCKMQLVLQQNYGRSSVRVVSNPKTWTPV